MLNRRESFKFLAGIPLVGWLFSDATASVPAMIEPGEFIVTKGLQPGETLLPTLNIPHEDGMMTCIPLGLNFKITEYSKEKVTDFNYRNGKLSSSDVRRVGDCPDAIQKPERKYKKIVEIMSKDGEGEMPENPSEYTTKSFDRIPHLKA